MTELNVSGATARPPAARSSLRRLAVTILIVVVATLIRAMIMQDLGARIPLFTVAIALAAMYGGFWQGVVATGLCAALVDYLYLPPVGSFHLLNHDDAMTLELFCATGLLCSFLADRAFRANRRLVALQSASVTALETAVAQRTRELAISEQRGLNIVESAPRGVLVVNRQGLIELVNARVEWATGYVRSELIGMQIEHLFPERFREAITTTRLALTAEQGAGRNWPDQEMSVLRKDGTEFAIAFGVAAMPEDGAVKIIVNVTDITAQKKAERALLASEEQMRTMIDSIRDHAIILLGPDGTILNWNAGAERVKGFRADEIVGHNISEFYLPEAVATGVPEANFLEAKQIGRCETEGLRLRKDGTSFLAQVIINSVHAASGELLGFVKVTRDISEKKLIEDALARSNDRMSIAAEAAKLGFWDFDVASQTLHWDEQMYRLYGQAPRSGRQSLSLWSDAIAPDMRAAVIEHAAESLLHSPKFHVDYRIEQPGGEEKYLRSGARVIRDADGASLELVGVCIDLTDLKLAETRIAEERDRAEAASRAKSGLLAMMSHEVRTPMNGVLGLNALLAETGLDPYQRKLSDGVRDSGELLLRLLNDILDTSKLEAGRLHIESILFNLSDLLDDAVALMAPLATEKGLALSASMSGECADKVYGDPTRLRQVILNLLSNAIKFTPRGSVRVHVHCERQADDQLHMRGEVADTGIGISAEAKPRLFRPFEQMDNTMARRFGGSGLGLSICRNLLTLMGGEIGMEDSPGGGATFWFDLVLPLSLDDIAIDLSAPENLLALAAPSTTGRDAARILLAEDNDLNVQLALMMLEPMGHVIDVAADGLQATELAAERRYELILMDIRMPELDGLGATRRIREAEAGSHVPIIAVTANTTPEDRELCREAGMDDFLAKPYDPEQLRETIGHWLGRSEKDDAVLPGAIAVPIPLTAIDDQVLAKLRMTVPEARFNALLDLGLWQIPKSLDRLQKADPQSREPVEIAWSMISTAVVFGAHRVVDAARRLVTACEAGKPGRIEAACANVIGEWEAALLELNLVRALHREQDVDAMA